MIGRRHQGLRLALFKGPNRAGVSLLSPEDGNGSSCRNVVLSSYLESRTMHKFQELRDSEYTHSVKEFSYLFPLPAWKN
jgi:hypothetical protein